MLKKLLISASLSVALLAATPAVATTVAVPENQNTEITVSGDQTNVESSAVPSEETNIVQQSELSRKMIQAEKARNAAENDKYGFAITLIAMSIVLIALIILSILFLLFGKISSAFQKSRKRQAHGVTAADAEDHHDELDSGEVIAAISMALAEHEGHGHDMEDTILTIRRMRKAYSPWNSKIYNMRPVREHVKARPAGQK